MTNEMPNSSVQKLFEIIEICVKSTLAYFAIIAAFRTTVTRRQKKVTHPRNQRPVVRPPPNTVSFQKMKINTTNTNRDWRNALTVDCQKVFAFN